MKAKQRFKIGSIIRISLSNNRIIFGRLLYEYGIGIYDYIVQENEIPLIEDIISKPIIIYAGIFKTVITKGYYEIIGYKKLNEEEIQSIPPSFNQDIININDCVIYWHNGNGKERKATPEECIGLEGSVGWDQENLVQRIEDYYDGRKNPYVELYNVILSKNDPRYLPPPGTLRWNFEKQEYYRTGNG